MSSIQLPLPFVEWKDIPGYEELYQVSNTGLVRRKVHTHRFPAFSLVRPRIDTRGYVSLDLYRNHVQYTHRVHRLVMLAFVGASDLTVNHKNAIKTDNRLENLEYLTCKENVHHAIKLGLWANHHGGGGHKGNHYGAKLTEDQVREVRRLYKEGFGPRQIARQYGLQRSTIQYIVRRKTWKHID